MDTLKTGVWKENMKVEEEIVLTKCHGGSNRPKIKS